MSRTSRLLAAGVAFAGLVLAQHADPSSDQERNLRAYIELMRSDVRAQKRDVLASVLGLNDQQGAKFWPIYTQYESELSGLTDRKLKVIRDYADNYVDMSDAKAHELALAVFDIEAARNDLKRKYYLQVEQATSSVVAARFMQVENQLLMLIDLQIASSLPIVR